jgi:hypothetical protein
MSRCNGDDPMPRNSAPIAANPTISIVNAAEKILGK